ncbi:MAG TPA: HAD family phosphatase [Dinghuibacter sp.]|uniref:HAD family hydrolase n=1 Tax=Dinghuibacter sp. TaxID=2024697 RepID=UPI002CE2421A|nr:HAD family phosphatase [Dinghuibacter sp.]HTJ14732.1 HAD family phosphatase [Dinghuibacter sp.]
MPEVKNLILDLGGVLLNLDYKKTKQAFAELGIADFDAHYTQFKGSPLFDELETGKVSPAAFYDAMRAGSGLALADAEIEKAWNAMLLDFPAERLALLEALRQRYRLFLLSNTNAIHYEAFQRTYREATGRVSLDDLFEKAYYSHLMGARKPDVEPFRMILEEQGLIAGETLFVDDTLPNLAGAHNLGIQTVHLQPPMKLEDLGL